MAQVPYQPFPENQPEDRISYPPQLQIHVNSDMFGGQVAQAIQHLGTTTSQVGDELFQRAIAMQELRNETEVTQATAQHELAARRQALDFTTNKLGMNAVNGYDAAAQAQNDLRDQFRAGLSNPAAQRMYDRYSLRIMNGELGNMAAHAAHENKVAADGENRTAIQVSLDGLIQNPTPENYAATIKAIDEKSATIADVQGWGPEETARKGAEARGMAMEKYIEGVNRTDPNKARQLFEANRQYMTYDQINRLEPKVQQQNRIVGSRQISDATRLGWAPYMTGGQIRTAESINEGMQRIVKKAQTDNPDLQIIPISGFRTAAQQQSAWDRYQRGEISLAARPGTSRHEVGLAVDLQPGANTSYAQVEAAMKKASADLGIPLSDEHDRIKGRDPGHYSLPRGFDAGTLPPKKDVPLQAQIDQGQAYADKNYPDDPLMADLVKQRIETGYRQDEYVKNRTISESMDTLVDRMMNRGDGNPAENIEQIRATPEGEAAYQKLLEVAPQKAATIPARLNAYHRSLLMQSDSQLLNRMDGMRAGDPEEFQKMDFIGDQSLQMSQRDRRTYWNYQQQDKRTGEPDKVVRRALSLPDVQAQLGFSDYNIKKGGDEVQKENYYDFIGSLNSAIQYETQRNNGKPPSDDELRTITKRILGAMPRQKNWFQRNIYDYGTDNFIFSMGRQLSDTEREDIRQKLTKENPGEVPSERDIDIRAAKDFYKDLYGGSKESTAKKLFGGQ